MSGAPTRVPSRPRRNRDNRNTGAQPVRGEIPPLPVAAEWLLPPRRPLWRGVLTYDQDLTRRAGRVRGRAGTGQRRMKDHAAAPRSANWTASSSFLPAIALKAVVNIEFLARL